MIQNDPNLEALRDEVLRDLRSAGLQPASGSTINWNSRFTRRAGTCKAVRRSGVSYSIEISSLLKGKDRALKDVICHELIHTCPCCFNHAEGFQQAAALMTLKGYDVHTIFSAEKAEAEQIEFAPRKPQPYKYAAVCESCGRMYKRKRICDVIRHPENYRCECGGKLKGYRLTQE